AYGSVKVTGHSSRPVWGVDPSQSHLLMRLTRVLRFGPGGDPQPKLRPAGIAADQLERSTRVFCEPAADGQTDATAAALGAAHGAKKIRLHGSRDARASVSNEEFNVAASRVRLELDRCSPR